MDLPLLVDPGVDLNGLHGLGYRCSGLTRWTGIWLSSGGVLVGLWPSRCPGGPWLSRRPCWPWAPPDDAQFKHGQGLVGGVGDGVFGQGVAYRLTPTLVAALEGVAGGGAGHGVEKPPHAGLSLKGCDENFNTPGARAKIGGVSANFADTLSIAPFPAARRRPARHKSARPSNAMMITPAACQSG